LATLPGLILLASLRREVMCFSVILAQAREARRRASERRTHLHRMMPFFSESAKVPSFRLQPVISSIQFCAA
jgi:hypothetical protein